MASNEGIALQIIVLGSSGGPFENNTTAFLVRSVAERWSKGSLLAVDAGVHLAAISNILDRTGRPHQDENRDGETEACRMHEQPKRVMCSGPFAGLELQHRSTKANAGYIASVLVETYLITHPHLDHISGLVVNSSGLSGISPKKIAGLPSTIYALKTHIFNNIIWPNLTDENNGAGLVTFLRLVESQFPATDSDDGKGFVEVCEGLQVKSWSVSHGRCFDKLEHDAGTAENLSQKKRLNRASSVSSHSTNEQIMRRSHPIENLYVYESTAFFIRDIATGTQILMFGDVEPDSISTFPRNRRIWTEAAPRIVGGQLRGIFIECSYDDTRTVDFLFGHLAPKYLIEEIKVLASEVERFRNRDKGKQRHASTHISECQDLKESPKSPQIRQHSQDLADSENDDTIKFANEKHHSNQSCLSSYIPRNIFALQPSNKISKPLNGVKFIIIHTKERLDDSPHVANIIHQQLLEHEKRAQLGCEFIISSLGQSLYF